ncbi:MAG TPA: TlpA disulfide reductase family protein [Chryseolinea sp.]|nr:TlpA disulfide reductase family protein [Chryseolinea sp.]
MEKVIVTLAQKIWKPLKPWCAAIALLLVLRYTGALSAISYATGSALMHTGIMDADTDEPAVVRKFNYNFKISDLQGKVSHANVFKNKVVFLNIWATWCGPCRMEMPSIQSLYNQVDTSKVAFIMLSVDRSQDLEKVKSYVKEKGFTFPVYVPAGTLPNQLQVSSIPSTFVVSPDGKIATSESGASNYDTPEFRAFLKGLLSPL